MNITHKNVCDLYRAYLDSKVPPSRKNCLSPEELLKFFHPKTGNRRKTRIIDHLSRCALCAREFELVLQIKRGEENLSRDIGTWLKSCNSHPKTRRNLWRNILLPQAFWKYAMIFFAVILLSTSIFILVNKKPVLPLKTPGERENHLPGIQLIEPVKGNYTKSRLLFRWEKHTLTDFYVLELYDEALSLLWRSPRLSHNLYSVPGDVMERLSCPKTYLWMVTAHTKTGGTIESPLIGFYLRE